MKLTFICFLGRTVIKGIYRNRTEPPPRSHPTPVNRNDPVGKIWHVRKAFICNRTGYREHWCRPIIFTDLVVFTVYSMCYISNYLYKITSALTKLRENVSIFRHGWERLDHKTLVMPTRPWMSCVAVLIRPKTVILFLYPAIKVFNTYVSGNFPRPWCRVLLKNLWMKGKLLSRHLYCIGWLLDDSLFTQKKCDIHQWCMFSICIFPTA